MPKEKSMTALELTACDKPTKEKNREVSYINMAFVTLVMTLAIMISMKAARILRHPGSRLEHHRPTLRHSK